MSPSEVDDRRVLEEAAERIADEEPVEWQARAAESPAAGSRLETLKVLERLARAFRGAAGRSGMPPPAAGPDETAEAVSWGHLRILEKLGEGGFGEVYRAHDPVLDRQVALKLRRERRAEDDRRYLDEARRLARVRHPNVLVVHGADVRDGRVGLWTDLIQGETLETLLQRQGPMGAQEATAVGLDLCRALAAVHAQGLLHGDVNTSNVMRERGGRIVLMDFGAVKEISGEGGGVTVSRGTPVAIAPELLRGEQGIPAADIYSLGVLLFRLVTGRYPVEGESLEEIARKHEHGAARPLRDLRPDLPAPFVRTVERALALSPRERFASAGPWSALSRTRRGGRRARPRVVMPSPGAAGALRSARARTSWAATRSWLSSSTRPRSRGTTRGCASRPDAPPWKTSAARTAPS